MHRVVCIPYLANPFNGLEIYHGVGTVGRCRYGNVSGDGRSPWFAANVSAGGRLLYHLYQGPLAVVGILPSALLFGYWFARAGRLWPLVVAHAILDALAVAAYQ